MNLTPFQQRHLEYAQSILQICDSRKQSIPVLKQMVQDKERYRASILYAAVYGATIIECPHCYVRVPMVETPPCFLWCRRCYNTRHFIKPEPL